MGYPVYKLLRAVNRQYPNNGFINYVDVREDMYDTNDESTNRIIDEDLRDLINETLQETYINVARDEVYSFPTVPGQREYSLPEDCDLRDIQEVTRTFRGYRCPPPHAHDKGKAWLIFEAEEGSGSMTPIEVKIGETINLPSCEFTPPEGKTFDKWMDDEGNQYDAGDPYLVEEDVTFTAVWKDEDPGVIYTFTLTNAVDDDLYITVEALSVTNVPTVRDLYYDESISFVTGDDGTLGSNYQYIRTYFQGVLLANYDMTEVLTRNVYVDVTHSVVPPGDNGDGGEDTNPLDDLIVTPIDNGDGGNGDNPLNDDNNNSGSSGPAVPVVTPTGGD